MLKAYRGIIMKREDGSERVNYNNDAFPSYIHKGWIEPGVSWGNVAHFHDDLEFTTVIEGRMGYNVNGKNIHLSEGDTIMVNSGGIHYSFATQKEKCRYYIYILHPSILCSSYEVESKAVVPITGNSSIPYLLAHAGTDFGEELYEHAKWLHASLDDEFKTTMEFFSLWNVIREYCVKNELSAENSSLDNALECYKRMHAYIRNNYINPITLNDIANAGNVSKTYCNRLFKRFTGQSPMETLIRYRAERVTYYLPRHDMTMAQIAEKTGFSGASYMTETFKKIYGVSPRDYLKEFRSQELF